MFSVIGHYTWLLIQALTGASLLTPVVLYLSNSLITFLKRQPPVSEELCDEKDFAVIVVLDDETPNAEQVIQPLLHLHYSNYLIYVVINTNSHVQFQVNEEKIVVIRTEKNCTQPVRFYRHIIENFKRPHTHLTIINNTIADEEYLNKLNIFFNKGYQAVQGVCAQTNRNRFPGFLCSVNHTYSNLFKNKLPFSLGSSSAITGCATAFHITLFKQCLKHLKVTETDFIRSLETEIINRGYQIAYSSEAVVFNNYTSNKGRLVLFHTKNTNLWLKQLARNSKQVYKGVLSLQFNSFLLGFIRVQPSLFTTLLMSVFCLLENCWNHPLIAVMWLGFLLTFALCFFIAFINSAGYNKHEKYGGFYQRLYYGFEIFFKKEKYAIAT